MARTERKISSVLISNDTTSLDSDHIDHRTQLFRFFLLSNVSGQWNRSLVCQ
jgi:hypothetical protein